MKVIIACLNSKYVHASLSSWCLLAGVREFSENDYDVSVAESTINGDAEAFANEIINEKPDVVAFSCYIWNRAFMEKLLNDLAVVRLEPVYPVSAKEHDEFIDCAVIAEKHLPDKHHRCHRHHHGAEEKGAEHTLSRDLGFQKQSKCQTKNNRKRNSDQRENRCVFCSSLEGIIAQQIFKVFQPDKSRISRSLNQRIVDHNAKGHNEKHQYTQNTG